MVSPRERRAVGGDHLPPGRNQPGRDARKGNAVVLAWTIPGLIAGIPVDAGSRGAGNGPGGDAILRALATDLAA